jgi:succinate dehydrogenase / fumarate reductase cytochrome b subunit
MSSTIGKKLLMALTGLFLIIFLIVHLIGNFQLLKDDGGMAFNIYAKFMTTNPLIKASSYILYATFIIHIVWSVLLTIKNRGSKNGNYVVVNASPSVTWSSRNMGILGTVILVFLIIHLKNFWYEMHWGGIATANYDGEEYKNLYAVVAAAFSEVWYVILYVSGMLGVAFHLYHGFQSAFQTLGINNKKYTPIIKAAGIGYSILIPLGFAIIPIIMFLK